jgi:hypothetical protein
VREATSTPRPPFQNPCPSEGVLGRVGEGQGGGTEVARLISACVRACEVRGARCEVRGRDDERAGGGGVEGGEGAREVERSIIPILSAAVSESEVIVLSHPSSL